MIKFNELRVVAALFGALLMGSPRLNACSCFRIPFPLDAAEASDAVFVGKVKEVVRANDGALVFPRIYRIEVLETFVGAPETSVLEFRSGGSTCAYNFEEGKSYLVYATRRGDRYGTNICTRTRPLESAEFDLGVLRGDQEALKPVALTIAVSGSELKLSATGGFGREWILEQSGDLNSWTKVTEFQSIFQETWEWTRQRSPSDRREFFRLRERPEFELAD